MTADDIRGHIAHIVTVSGDDEAAHSSEDDLREAFITYVSTDPKDDELGDKAKLVLSTGSIDFGRWCA